MTYDPNSHQEKEAICKNLVSTGVFYQLSGMNYIYFLKDTPELYYNLIRKKWIWKHTRFPLEEIVEYMKDKKALELILFNLNDLKKL